MTIKNGVFQWDAFPQIQSAGDLAAYMDERVSGHSYFYHYTTLRAIDKILETKSFRISCVDQFNDEVDKQQFGSAEKRKRYFATCFSSGKNENLVLWYLYSGISGKGGRIGFTKTRLEQMIKNGRFLLVAYDYKKRKPIGKRRILLMDDENCKISFQDVLYYRCSEKDKYASLKYNTMTNYGKIPASDFTIFKERYAGFLKTMIWYHEKETRLLIELTEEMASKLSLGKDYAIFWEPGEENFARAKITLAPEILDFTELEHYSHIKEFQRITSNVTFSENKGEINMNLCKNCQHAKT